MRSSRSLRLLGQPNTARLSATVRGVRLVTALLRYISSVLFALLAILSLMILFFGLFGWRQQRQHDYEIQAAFVQSAKLASDFSVSNGRLPSESEFALWMAQQPPALGNHIHQATYRRQSPPKELTDVFGFPTKESYYLEIWRGEWSEYYASWVDRSTIEPSDFKWFIQLYFPIIGFGFAFVSGFSYMSYRLLRSSKPFTTS